ncbi:MAG: 50S ribosomal protein L24e [Candidatus Aenigmarchaeota archaeon]|nr:50S ribosomal protein L24e [Candidatus Aenigmarchaeota archaeon]MDI6722207.1 50S ribosomal protein L24e [Candidatus Aenigmarchaeota archaeon]
MPKCSFCSKSIEFGTGKTLVLNNGKVMSFCSGRCEKNRINLGRDPRNFKWAQN